MNNHINSYVKTFLEESKDIIDDLPKLYEKSLNYGEFYTGSFTPLLTETLLNADINPLSQLDYIPDYYLQESNIKSFEIPKHIKTIGESAFEYCEELISIKIPKNVAYIGAFAFSNCFKIARLEIENPNLDLNIGVFENFVDALKFNGTQEQWEEFKRRNAWDPDINRLILIDKIIAK